MSDINVKTWDKMYAEGRSLLEYPDENVVAVLNKYRRKLKSGLDLACGAGRHTFLMADNGFTALGIDSSMSAVNFAKEKAKKLNYENACFKCSNVQEIILEKEAYDLIIVWGLFHYLDKNDREGLIKKIYSALSTNGILLSTLRSIQDSRVQNGKRLAQNTYLVDYFDKDTISPKKTKMYFWNEEEAKGFFADFREVYLGHRLKQPIGDLKNKTAHWLIEAHKGE